MNTDSFPFQGFAWLLCASLIIAPSPAWALVLSEANGRSEGLRPIRASERGRPAPAARATDVPPAAGLEEARLVSYTTIPGRKDYDLKVNFAPGGSLVVLSTQRNTKEGPPQVIQIWDIEQDYPRMTHESTTSSVSAFAMSPDGRHLVTGHYNGGLQLWDVQDTALEPSGWLKEPRQDDRFESVHSIAFNPDGQLVAATGWNDGSVRVWDLKSQEERFVLRPFITQHGGEWPGISLASAWSPDENFLATVANDARLTVWWLRGDGIQIGTVLGVDRAAFHPDGRLFVYHHSYGHPSSIPPATVFEIRDLFDLVKRDRSEAIRKTELHVPGATRTDGAVFSPTGDVLAVVYNDSHGYAAGIALYETPPGTQELFNVPFSDKQFPGAVEWSFDATGQLMAAQTGQAIKVWRVEGVPASTERVNALDSARLEDAQIIERLITNVREQSDPWDAQRFATILQQYGWTPDQVDDADLARYYVLTEQWETLLRLGETRGIKVVLPALEEWLKTGHGEKAAEVLGRLGDPQAVPILLDFGHEASRDALVAIGAPAAGPLLRRLLKEAPLAALRGGGHVHACAFCLDVLERLKTQDKLSDTFKRSMTKRLLNALDDSREGVAPTAAEALGRLSAPEPRVVAALLKAFQEGSGMVPLMAAEALGRLGASEPEVLWALRGAVRESDEPVQHYAVEALGRLGDVEAFGLVAEFFLRQERVWNSQVAVRALAQLSRRGGTAPTLSRFGPSIASLQGGVTSEERASAAQRLIPGWNALDSASQAYLLWKAKALNAQDPAAFLKELWAAAGIVEAVQAYGAPFARGPYGTRPATSVGGRIELLLTPEELERLKPWLQEHTTILSATKVGMSIRPVHSKKDEGQPEFEILEVHTPPGDTGISYFMFLEEFLRQQPFFLQHPEMPFIVTLGGLLVPLGITGHEALQGISTIGPGQSIVGPIGDDPGRPGTPGLHMPFHLLTGIREGRSAFAQGSFVGFFQLVDPDVGPHPHFQVRPVNPDRDWLLNLADGELKDRDVYPTSLIHRAFVAFADAYGGEYHRASTLDDVVALLRRTDSTREANPLAAITVPLLQQFIEWAKKAGASDEDLGLFLGITQQRLMRFDLGHHLLLATETRLNAERRLQNLISRDEQGWHRLRADVSAAANKIADIVGTPHRDAVERFLRALAEDEWEEAAKALGISPIITPEATPTAASAPGVPAVGPAGMDEVDADATLRQQRTLMQAL